MDVNYHKQYRKDLIQQIEAELKMVVKSNYNLKRKPFENIIDLILDCPRLSPYARFDNSKGVSIGGLNVPIPRMPVDYLNKATNDEKVIIIVDYLLKSCSNFISLFFNGNGEISNVTESILFQVKAAAQILKSENPQEIFRLGKQAIENNK